MKKLPLFEGLSNYFNLADPPASRPQHELGVSLPWGQGWA